MSAEEKIEAAAQLQREYLIACHEEAQAHKALQDAKQRTAAAFHKAQEANHQALNAVRHPITKSI